jgi:hypothetical protein
MLFFNDEDLIFIWIIHTNIYIICVYMCAKRIIFNKENGQKLMKIFIYFFNRRKRYKFFFFL